MFEYQKVMLYIYLFKNDGNKSYFIFQIFFSD